jgi:hypothetical protein
VSQSENGGEDFQSFVSFRFGANLLPTFGSYEKK